MTQKDMKRYAVKHIRDGIKSKYKKGKECQICGSTELLEFHHFHSVSDLLYKYCDENNVDISSDAAAVAMRATFYKAHWFELVEDATTLCKMHHSGLHSVYGRNPPLSSAPKQREWVVNQTMANNQEPNHPNTYIETPIPEVEAVKPTSNRFARFRLA